MINYIEWLKFMATKKFLEKNPSSEECQKFLQDMRALEPAPLVKTVVVEKPVPVLIENPAPEVQENADTMNNVCPEPSIIVAMEADLESKRRWLESFKKKVETDENEKEVQ
ncbi:MAG: hypothetical protein ABIA21_00670 [Candidatus Aenigmatarchaeota archaeon]